MTQNNTSAEIPIEEFKRMERELTDITRAMHDLEEEVVAKLEEQKITAIEKGIIKSE